MSDLDKQIAARIAKAVRAADDTRLQAKKRRARKAADEAYQRVMMAKDDEDGLMDQSIPRDDDECGRSSAAKAIRSLLRKAPQDEIQRHFSAADVNNMVKTLDDTEVEMRQTAHTERYLGNHHQSLDDPYGDILRKGGGAPITTALDTLKKLQSGYLFEELAKSGVKLRPGVLQKALGSSRRSSLLVKGLDGVTREIELGTGTPQLPTVRAIAKALRHPQPYTPDFLHKATLPPQDEGADDGGEIADTGAVNDWSSQGQTASAVRADQMLGAEHAEAMHDLSRAPRVVGDDEVAVPTETSRSRPERRTTPVARPPSLQTRAQNLNADDSGSSETIDAIKEAQRNPKPLWG